MHEALQFKVHRVVGLRTILGLLRAKQIFRATAQTRHVPGKSRFGNSLGYASSPALGHGDHAVEGFVSENFGERGPHSSERKSVTRKRAANAAHIAVLEFLLGNNAIGDFLRKAVGRARNAGTNGLSEDENIRIQILRAREPSGPGANCVRFVDDEQRAMLAREVAESLVISLLWMHDANIRHRGLS